MKDVSTQVEFYLKPYFTSSVIGLNGRGMIRGMMTALSASRSILSHVDVSEKGSSGWGVCVAYGQTSK